MREPLGILAHLVEHCGDQAVAEVVALVAQSQEQRLAAFHQATLLGQHQNSGGSNQGQPLAAGLGPAATVIDQQQNVVADVALLDGQGDGTGFSGVDTWIQRFPWMTTYCP